MRHRDYHCANIRPTRSAPPSFYELLASRPIACFVCFDQLPEGIQQNKELVYALVRAGVVPHVLEQKYCYDRDLILSSSSEDMFLCQPDATFSIELLADREVALHAVSKCKRAYRHLSEEFKGDRELFLAHAENCADPFEDAPQDLGA